MPVRKRKSIARRYKTGNREKKKYGTCTRQIFSTNEDRNNHKNRDESDNRKIEKRSAKSRMAIVSCYQNIKKYYYG